MGQSQLVAGQDLDLAQEAFLVEEAGRHHRRHGGGVAEVGGAHPRHLGPLRHVAADVIALLLNGVLEGGAEGFEQRAQAVHQHPGLGNAIAR